MRVVNGAHVVVPAVYGQRWESVREDRNLVDPASSHTLVLKIKPCMSKYKQPIL